MGVNAVITKLMLEKADEKNADFQHRLTPTLPRESFLGIRVPELRKIEKEYRNSDEAKLFLSVLPHKYYDENLLHSVFISNMKNYEEVLLSLKKFLPYVDNWAVCDTLKPNAFKKNKSGLIEMITEWIFSPETYNCRFGVDMLMTFFLDGDFKPEYLDIPAKVHSDEYYVNMMISWFYATALSKHWDETVKYLENKKLSVWVHNKTIVKACESYRITDDQKIYLKTLKILTKTLDNS